MTKTLSEMMAEATRLIPSVLVRQHVPRKCDADCSGCGLCDGGLIHCVVCGAAEAELPTECPGRKMSVEECADVNVGDLDFVGGKWVRRNVDTSPIASFAGEYRFLSNFYPVQIVYEGFTYPSTENAYQAAKSLDVEERRRFQERTPAAAKMLGRTITLRPDWESVKVSVMRDLLRLKFADKALGDKLLATGDRDLVEGNYWGDHFWGVCNGVGENWLGRLLVQVRGELRCPPVALIKRSEPKPSAVFDTYWRFAAERQAMYFRRLRGVPAPWTQDPILAEYRFTNVYRASDRVSQYLIRNVIYDSDGPKPIEVISRILLFKIFNKISTWESLCRGFIEMGAFRICANDIVGVVENPLIRILNEMKARGETLYSAAYVMPSPGNAAVKHKAHIELLGRILVGWRSLVEAKSLQALYETLLAWPSLGPFLAYQLAIDLNYSEIFAFDEDDFVVPGPGALDGLRKCFTDFGEYSEAEVIRWTCDRQEREIERLGLSFETLFGRRLKLIDLQNIFCEVSKYTRVSHPEVAGVSGRTKIKQKYKVDPTPLPAPFFPTKWGLVVK